jgi:hypothetical protein
MAVKRCGRLSDPGCPLVSVGLAEMQPLGAFVAAFGIATSLVACLRSVLPGLGRPPLGALSEDLQPYRVSCHR